MINPEHFTYAIIMMAAITFSVRYAFFTRGFEINLSPQIKNILTFTAPCVLTAMFVPIMFQDVLSIGGHGVSGEAVSVVNASIWLKLITSSYFWASMFAIVASFVIRQTLLVIVLSMVVFYVLRLFVFA